MKMKPLLRWMIAVGVIVVMATRIHGASYTITAAPGWNLIANQLNSDSGNVIRNIILRPPLGSQLQRFNLSTHSFDTLETYKQQLLTAIQAWSPGTNILNPGDGLYFYNPSDKNLTLSFSGIPHSPVLPLNIGPGLALVARQTNDVATLKDILGFSPSTLTAVYRFIPGLGQDPTVFTSSNYTIYAFSGRTWITPPGAPPVFNVGESVWITTNGSLPVIQRHPISRTLCAGGEVVFAGAATGSLPLSYQWLQDGKPIPNATAASYSIVNAATSNSGSYSLRVSNPFGSITSSNATLFVGDNQAPVLFCPTNIIASCRGLGGTTVSFKVDILDNCDPQPTVISVPPSGSIFPPGVTTVVSTGFDASGNTNTCSFTVTVLDNIPPQIVCPPDQVAVARDPRGAQVFYSVKVSDNCDPDPKIESIPPSGSFFPPGETVVTCKSSDSSGNSSMCTFTVSVIDQSCCQGKLWKIADVVGPGGRFGHAMAYDSVRGRVVLFGGEGSQGGLLADTWEWDGKVWSRISAEGPVPRAHAAMAFDARLSRVVMHGGRGVANTVIALDDTWLWDGVKWQLVGAKSVGGRYNHAMAYDSLRQVTVLHGGANANGADLDDTWEFDGKAWNKVSSSTGPGPRQGHAMVYGASQGQLLLFGGQYKTQVFGDTWQWDGKLWRLIAKDGPAPRAFHAMAYNDGCDSVILFGGGVNGIFGFDDTWEWDGKTWSQTASKKPGFRGQTALAHDSAHDQTVLVGGTVTTKEWMNDTWLLGLDQTPPQVVSVDAACGDHVILVAFDKPVSASSVQDTNHYALVCGDSVKAIVQAVLTEDPRIVQVFTPDSVNLLCRFVISGVQDSCGRIVPTYQTGIQCRQDPCVRGSTGSEFWLTFPGNFVADPASQPKPQLFLFGLAGTIGTVSMPGLANIYTVPFAIPAAGITQISLPREADLADAIDVTQSNAVHVVASRPISVYGLNHIPFTSDAYLGLSTRAIGKTYIVMAYGNLFTNVPDLNGSQFAIAAGKDNTVAMIVPSVAVGSHPAGVPFSVSMMKGQTYQLRCTNGYPADLTGTIIVADQPVSVFAGHRSATVPNNNGFFADYLVEQLPPTDTWGTNFISVPLATRSQGDTFRIMALLNGTTVTTNGVVVSTLLDSRKFVEFRLAAAARIVSDKPILVAQYANSSDFDQVTNADPFMVILPPVDFYSSSYLVPAPSADFSANYLNLIVPNSSIRQVILDSATLPPSIFSTIGTSGYSGAQVSVGVGAHQVSTASGVAFGLIAYGWSLYDAYGFAGQSCGSVLSQSTEFRCPPGELSVATGPGCLAPVPDLAKISGVESQALLVTQDPAAGTLVEPGTHILQLTAIDSLGNPHSCRTFLTVRFGNSAGLQCPLNIVTNCNSQGGQYVFFDVEFCNTNFTLNTVPPSGSFFPTGVTKVLSTVTNAAGAVETCTFTVTVECDSNPPTPVKMNISKASSNLSIDWTGPGVLQQATKVSGPWVSVTDATSPFRVPTTNSASFFRIIYGQ